MRNITDKQLYRFLRGLLEVGFGILVIYRKRQRKVQPAVRPLSASPTPKYVTVRRRTDPYIGPDLATFDQQMARERERREETGR